MKGFILVTRVDGMASWLNPEFITGVHETKPHTLICTQDGWRSEITESAGDILMAILRIEQSANRSGGTC